MLSFHSLSGHQASHQRFRNILARLLAFAIDKLNGKGKLVTYTMTLVAESAAKLYLQIPVDSLEKYSVS